MDFPIVDLLDDELNVTWLLEHFHPQGLRCPHCQASVEQAREFRRTQASGLMVYRCRVCAKTYNVYSGTVFEGRHLHPAQVILLLRGVSKGEPTLSLARELDVSRQTVHELRHRLQAKAERLQPTSALPDTRTETDELFQNAGEKR